jgi:transcription initiation factor TFIID TATA-box-binding protein
LEIVNIVAIALMNQPFDLELMSEKIDGSEFPLSGKRWLKMRIKPENYYTAFYKSGKFLITGVKNLDKVNETAQRILNILKKAGINAELKTIKIHNIVLIDKIELNQSLDNLIISMNDQRASYEPEQFPGIIYKDKKEGINYLLFSNGKIVITGVTDVELAKKNLEIFKNKIGVIHAKYPGKII